MENIDVNTFDATKGESAATILPSLIRKYPNVYVFRDLSDTEAAKLLLGEVRDEDRLLITNVHAKSAPEALLRMLQLKVPHKEFATLVTGVICTRLIRKLCPDCKVGYTPPGEVLKKWNSLQTIATKGLGANAQGIWLLKATLFDGSTYSVWIEIKK